MWWNLRDWKGFTISISISISIYTLTSRQKWTVAAYEHWTAYDLCFMTHRSPTLKITRAIEKGNVIWTKTLENSYGKKHLMKWSEPNLHSWVPCEFSRVFPARDSNHHNHPWHDGNDFSPPPPPRVLSEVPALQRHPQIPKFAPHPPWAESGRKGHQWWWVQRILLKIDRGISQL